MPQSLSSLLVHLIFSTKDRYPFLGESDLLRSTHAYLGGILRRVSPWCNTLPAKSSIIERSVSKTNFKKSCASTGSPSTSVNYGTSGSSDLPRFQRWVIFGERFLGLASSA